MGNRLVFICTVLLMSIHSFGQDANWLGFNDLKQNNPVLPGQLKSEEGLTIVLPGLSSTLFQSGVPIGDFLKETTPGVYQLDFSDVLDDIDASNKIQAEFKVPVIGVDYRKGANMFSLNYGIRAQSSIEYSKGLIDLYQLGNAPFIGETMDLSHQLLMNNYHELSFGYARDLGKVSIGGRLKLLSGISDLSTPENDLALFTDPDIYQLSLTTTEGMTINTSGVLDYNGIDDVSVNYNLFSFSSFGKNLGIGLDAGLSGKIDKLSFGLSVIDLGNINWSTDTKEYRSATETLYEGIDLLDFFDDANDIVVEDSLKQLLQLDESEVEYSTKLYSKIYAVIGYEISDKYALSLFYINDRIGEYNSIGLINQIDLDKYKFNLSAQFTKGTIAVGAGAVFDFSPIQIILSSDNLLGTVNLESQNFASARLGLNLSF